MDGENVVVLAGVEGWVEVDEVDGVRRDGVAQDGEVVAVVKLVLLGRFGNWGKGSRCGFSLKFVAASPP
jgi:hypothetical protein